MAFNLQEHIPALRYKDVPTTQTWTTLGTTHTVTDGRVATNSVILIQHTTVPAGRWSIAVADGSFVITSSDSEATTCTFNYIIL